MSYKWEIKHGGTRVGGLDVKYPDDYLQTKKEEIMQTHACSIVVLSGNIIMILFLVKKG